MVVVTEETSSQQRVYDGLPFPRLTRIKDCTDVEGWVHNNISSVSKWLVEHGVVILRGLPVDSPDAFSKFILATKFEEFPYVGGNAVRTLLAPRVFTTNESPPSEIIPFHHELAQAPKSPSLLGFFCLVPPSEGGETSILRSDVVYEELCELMPEFMSKLEQHGVRYIRVLSEEDDPKSAIGRGWKSTYWSSDKEVIEKKLRDDGYDLEWLPNSCLKTISPILAPIRTDPRTGKKVFFNQMVAAYTGWKDSRNDPKKALVHGNGDAIDEKCMNAMVELFDRHRVNIPWEQGDIMLVDNTIAMHARMPFSGPRKILASLIKY